MPDFVLRTPDPGALERDAFALVPSDADAYASPIGLYVGVAGDVAVTTPGGADVVFKNVPAGARLPIRVSKVKATGTTATFLVGLGVSALAGASNDAPIPFNPGLIAAVA